MEAGKGEVMRVAIEWSFKDGVWWCRVSGHGNVGFIAVTEHGKFKARLVYGNTRWLSSCEYEAFTPFDTFEDARGALASAVTNEIIKSEAQP